MRLDATSYRKGETALNIAPENAAEWHQIMALRQTLDKNGVRWTDVSNDCMGNPGGVTVFLKWPDEEAPKRLSDGLGWMVTQQLCSTVVQLADTLEETAQLVGPEVHRSASEMVAIARDVVKEAKQHGR